MPVLSNSRHETFAQVFTARRSFVIAARASGSQAEDLSVAGIELYGRDDVRARVAELTAERIEPIMSRGRLLTEVGRMAVVDYSSYYHIDGTQKGPHELTAEQSSCVRGTDSQGRYQFWDKNPPVQLLAKHFKVVSDEGDGVSALASALAERLNSARKRLGESRMPVIDSSASEGASEGEGEQLW